MENTSQYIKLTFSKNKNKIGFVKVQRFKFEYMFIKVEMIY